MADSFYTLSLHNLLKAFKLQLQEIHYTCHNRDQKLNKEAFYTSSNTQKHTYTHHKTGYFFLYINHTDLEKLDFQMNR